MDTNKMREQFQSKFPTPIGMVWCDVAQQYIKALGCICPATAIAGHNQLWKCWQASRATSWQPMESCPKHVEVLFYREDCGVISGQLTCADTFMTDKDRESGDYSEEEQYSEDAWCYGPDGVERLDGDLVPTHWMPYPDEPEVTP
ncbi:hypothetical protein IRZ53_17530 [Pseudomonas fulva]|uniref:hypothetical protein n=1 Tax=Pseudomonas fulva TaxID=47880 RepID=UPI0018A9C41E|nr:hypothetical protein [Pseudomonas fulva]MBF8676197.1 hypothetical protein [Pseudomonas fulva]MBF8698585.1 hypothetical protein [Pseudomonas fulva]